MSVDISTEVSRRCSTVPSFGEVLNEIRQQRKMSQETLGRVIVRSPADVSRLMNNKVPKYLTLAEVRAMATRLGCSRVEMVELINAFICHLFYTHEIIDPDVY
jgi:transcriptional regulator with XRE-family HTH domain